MSRSDVHGTGRLAGDPLPGVSPVVLPATAGPVALVLPAGLLVRALRRLAAADSRADVASATLPLLLELRGVRAAAVVGRDAGRVVVLASAGYDCASMAAGGVLPLDAGLAVTEAVRTGRLVQQGTGPAWIALPFGGGRPEGALLLSLTVAPPTTSDELDELAFLASALGDALRRAGAQERTFLELALVTASLATPRLDSGPDVVHRSLPLDGVLGGDLALRLPDGRGGRWLLVADVGRLGLEAAVTARTLHAAGTALAPHLDDPADLLRALDAVLSAAGSSAPVTAVAARVTGSGAATRVALARASHPSLVVLHDGRSSVVPAPPGSPLGLGVEPGGSVTTALPAGAVLMLHSDGLTARARAVSPVDLLAAGSGGDLDALADDVLRRAAAAGPACDDVTLLLARAGVV